ncbi:MAG: hypothetical protein GJ676_16755 [Rhodobacteraceae bacterium]|nr:hypothetical protein [Paracoccaceae bacterium]
MAHSYFDALKEMAREFVSDCDQKAEVQTFSYPLWKQGQTFALPEFSHSDGFDEYRDGRIYTFWRSWHDGFVKGTPLDWELQRRVALIDDAIWDVGPEAVATEIEKIRKLFELEQEIAKLKEQMAASVNVLPSMIGDNGGPPLEDAQVVALQRELALARQQISRLETEIAKSDPEPSKLDKIARALWEISVRIAKYCGQKADLFLSEGMKESGKAIGKWGTGAAIATVTAQSESIQSVAKAAWALARTLAGG